MPVAATWILERTELGLADTIRITLRIDGPAPLRVEPAKNWLAPASAEVWKVEVFGAARRLATGDGERWEQDFELSPFAAGASVPFEFQPISVNGQPVPIPETTFSVRATLQNPTVEDARPITEREGIPLSSSAGNSLLFPVVSGTIGLALTVLIAMRIRKLGRRKPTVDARSALQAALLRAGELPYRERAILLAAAVRKYLTQRFSIPATAYSSTSTAASSSTPSTSSFTTRATETT